MGKDEKEIINIDDVAEHGPGFDNLIKITPNAGEYNFENIFKEICERLLNSSLNMMSDLNEMKEKIKENKDEEEYKELFLEIELQKEKTKTVINKLNKLSKMGYSELKGLSLEQLNKLINEPYQFLNDIDKDLLETPHTRLPSQYIMPRDKVTQQLFFKSLPEGLAKVRTSGYNAKKELSALVNIEFESLESVNTEKLVNIDFESLENVKISGEFNYFDWTVHNSIVSIYINTSTKYMTPLTIYRTMTGNSKAKLTDSMKMNIIKSIAKLESTKITIDAKEEAKGFGMDEINFESRAILMEKVKAKHKGKVGEWFHILTTPILYRYANSKNHVDRMDIALLNAPINTTTESLKLRSYLQVRIIAMKNPGNKLSKTITYNTIYKEMDIDEKMNKDTLRKKKGKIRKTVKTILDYWIDKNFIKGYKENLGSKNSINSLTIKLK